MTASELQNTANSLAFKVIYYKRETMEREAFADGSTPMEILALTFTSSVFWIILHFISGMPD